MFFAKDNKILELLVVENNSLRGQVADLNDRLERQAATFAAERKELMDKILVKENPMAFRELNREPTPARRFVQAPQRPSWPAARPELAPPRPPITEPEKPNGTEKQPTQES